MEPTTNTTTEEVTEKVEATTQPEPVKTIEENNNTLMGILAYLGILVLIPFITQKDNSFVKFHVKQGFVLLAIEIAFWVLGSVLSVGLPVLLVTPIILVMNLATLALAIFGIINVINGKEKELPVVGKYSSHINI